MQEPSAPDGNFHLLLPTPGKDAMVIITIKSTVHDSAYYLQTIKKRMFYQCSGHEDDR